MIFRQIRSNDGTGTLSYILADSNTSNGIIIDPNIEDLENIKQLVKAAGINLIYVIDTHTHADHISAAGELKKIYGTKLIMHVNTKDKWKVIDEGDKFGIGDILRANAAFQVDSYIEDDHELAVDSIKMKFLFTPGHTDNHLAVLADDKLFTGDLLLIGQAGRSDLPGGNPTHQYDSLFDKILTLPGSTKIYPGHDYEDNEFAYLEEEIINNPFLKSRSREEYLEFVKDFFPPITETAVNGKSTLQCGTKRVITEKEEPFRDINASQLARMIRSGEEIFLLDVREPFELMAFGAIPGVVNIPVGQIVKKINELPAKDKALVVICQSGNRSYEVAHYLSTRGFKKIYNLEGGTSSWVYSRDPEVLEYNKVV